MVGRFKAVGRRGHPNELLLVLAITVISAVLRAPLLGTGLWRDEAYTYFDSSATSVHALLHRLTLGETHPPLFFFTEYVWGRVAGWSDISLKLPAYVFGIILVPSAYLLGRAVGGRSCAAVAAVLVACDARQMYYSADARPYSLAALEIVVLAWLFSGWLRARSFGLAIAVVVVGMLLLYTQYSGVIFIVALGIYSLAFLNGRARLAALLLVGMTALTFAPWGSHALAQLTIAAPWRTWIPYALRPVVVLELIGGTIPIVRGNGVATMFTGAFLIVATTVALKRYGWPSPALAITVLGLDLGALIEASFSYRDARYMVPFAPLAIVFVSWLIGRTLSELKPKVGSPAGRLVISAAALGALVIVGVNGTLFSHATSVRSKSGMRDLVGRLADDRQSTVYLCAPDYSAATLGFYGRGQLHLRGFARWDSPEIFDLHGYPEIWSDPGLLDQTLARVNRERELGYRELVLVYGGRSGARPIDAGRIHYAAVGLLRAALLHRYRLVSVEQFDGIEESFTAYRLSLTQSVARNATLRRPLPTPRSS